MESVLGLLASRRFSLAVAPMSTMLANPDCHPISIGSVLIPLVTAWLRASEEEKRLVGKDVYKAVACWMVSARSIVRALAILMATLVDRELGTNGCVVCANVLGRLDRKTRKLIGKMDVEHRGRLCFGVHDLTWLFGAAGLDPEVNVSLATLVATGVPSLLGELCASDLMVDRAFYWIRFAKRTHSLLTGLAEHVREYMREFFEGGLILNPDSVLTWFHLRL